MFGWDFENDTCSRFWRCNLIKICDMTYRSYIGKQNSTPGPCGSWRHTFRYWRLLWISDGPFISWGVHIWRGLEAVAQTWDDHFQVLSLFRCSWHMVIYNWRDYPRDRRELHLWLGWNLRHKLNKQLDQMGEKSEPTAKKTCPRMSCWRLWGAGRHLCRRRLWWNRWLVLHRNAEMDRWQSLGSLQTARPYSPVTLWHSWESRSWVVEEGNRTSWTVWIFSMGAPGTRGASWGWVGATMLLSASRLANSLVKRIKSPTIDVTIIVMFLLQALTIFN